LGNSLFGYVLLVLSAPLSQLLSFQIDFVQSFDQGTNGTICSVGPWLFSTCLSSRIMQTFQPKQQGIVFWRQPQGV